MEGVKESKEVMIVMLKLAQLLAASFKDGVQAADFAVVMAKIMSDEELKKAMLEAYNGVDKVGKEMKDVSLAEAFELIQAAVPEVLKLVEQLKK